MKILILSSGTPSSSLSHRVIALGRELVLRGHKVSMIAPSFDRHSGWKLDNPGTIDGISMIYPFQLRTKSFLLNLIPYIFSATLKVLFNSADIVYLYKPTPATIPALLAKWIKRTPVILDMDDLGSEVMEIEGQPAPIWRLVAACEHLAARHASAIVVVSRLLEKEIKSRFPKTPLALIPNGVDPSEFIAVPASPGRQPRIIFFGILARTRILSPILEALPEVIEKIGSARVQLEILGDGAKRGEMEVIARKLKLTENVHFRGWTNFNELSNFAASGDIALCIMPDERTTNACSNQKVFQYQALELATVVSRVGDLPLYVDNGQAGIIIEAGDTRGLSRALISLLSDAPLRASLGIEGRKLATSKYSWSNLAARLNDHMEQVR